MFGIIKAFAQCFEICARGYGGTCGDAIFADSVVVEFFHNDVDINKIFETVYLVVMNEPPQGINIMEITYSIGLALGIIVFFNHVGPRKLTKDPTPIAVSMHQYEVDVDETLIELANREGKEEDV